MGKKYDMLLVHLHRLIQKFYFSDLKDVLIPIGANDKFPDAADINYAAIVAAIFLLHIHEVDIDSGFLDIQEAKANILKACSDFDDLREQLKEFKRSHYDDQDIIDILNSNRKFEA